MPYSHIRHQQTYDHRLRDLVRATGDPNMLAELSVPRSTALGWLRRDYQPVVTADVLDIDHIRLQAKVLRRRQPNRSLTAAEILAMKRMVESPESRHVPTGRLAILAQRLGTVVADAGVENVNAGVDELIDSGLLRRVLALRDVTFSNAMIEAWWRTLKHPWLYLHTLDSLQTLIPGPWSRRNAVPACARPASSLPRRAARVPPMRVDGARFALPQGRIHLALVVP